MSITRDEVIQGYVSVLGRHPESDAVITWHSEHSETVWQFISCLITSTEFQKRVDIQDTHIYRGYTDKDVELLKKYQIHSSGKKGFVTSFVGSRTNVNFFKFLDELSGTVEGLPIPGCFHASAVEWVGALKAVDQARDSFSVLEIGAGWGPWLVDTALVAKSRGINNLYMLGIEADPGHFEYLQAHLREHGFDPKQGHLINGIVAQKDGVADYPVINSQENWGAAAVFDDGANVLPGSIDTNLTSSFITLKSYCLETLISDHEYFDLCHFDVQGAENAIISGSRALLQAKARILVIGTHSRKIEGDLIEMLSADGWLLENERPCVFSLNPNRERVTFRNTTIDGTQVWRNPRL